MPKNPRWFPKEIGLLWKLSTHMTQQQIGDRIGRSQHAVDAKMRELGIKSRQGLVTLLEAHRILGTDRKVIRNYLRKVRAGQDFRDRDYHMTNEEFGAVAQLMLDTGTIRSVGAKTLRKVIQDYS